MEHRSDLARILHRCEPNAVEKLEGQLIVLEANSFARSALARFFESVYECVHALDSLLDAEEALSKSEGWTDLIVAECLPHDISGSELAASWRVRYPQLRRVVLATGSDSLPENAASLDAVFRKPFNVQELGLFLSS